MVKLIIKQPIKGNTAVKRLRMCELSLELRFFFKTYKGALIALDRERWIKNNDQQSRM